MDAPGKDGKASMPAQVKRPNPWMMMMMMMMMTMMMMLVQCRSNKYRARLALAHEVRRRRALRQAALRHLATENCTMQGPKDWKFPESLSQLWLLFISDLGFS